MRITSKYPGRCKLCGELFDAGDEIEWEAGKGAAHPACVEAQIDQPVQPDDPFFVSEDVVEDLFEMNRRALAARLDGGLTRTDKTG